MMGIETIRQVNRDIARKAAREHKQPYVPDSTEEIATYLTGGRGIPFPNFGYFVPKKWERVNEGYEGEGVWFVDKCGVGGGGGDLSAPQFKAELAEWFLEHPDHGYAIVEEGQFQCYVAAFRLKEWRKGK